MVLDDFFKKFTSVLDLRLKDLKEKFLFLKLEIDKNRGAIESAIKSLGSRTKKADLSAIDKIDIENFSLISKSESGQKRKRSSTLPADSNLFQIEDINKAMVKLGFDGGSIISTVDVANFGASEISDALTLQRSLEKCQSEIMPNQHKVIIFKVNAKTTDFSDNQNENNHYVGLVVAKDSNGQHKVTYIDPTGRPINDNIQGIVLNKMEGINSQHVVSSQIQLQEYDDAAVMGTNCGPFLVYLAKLVALDRLQVELVQRKITNKDESNRLGLQLREFYDGTDTVLPNLDDYLNQHLRLVSKAQLQSISSDGKINLKKILQNHIYQNQHIHIEERLRLQSMVGDFEIEPNQGVGNDIEHSISSVSLDLCSRINLLPENNHLLDHESYINNLISKIKSRELTRENTVIVLERKQYGQNLGMSDVILLAKLIKREEELKQQNPDSKISLIPDDVRGSLIYQDAVLYKIAEENGIEVVGVDKAKISVKKPASQDRHHNNQQWQEYNREREEYMAMSLAKIAKSHPNHNILFPIGAVHISGLVDKLKHQQKRPGDEVLDLKKSINMSLSSDLAGVTDDLKALKERMMLQDKRAAQKKTGSKSKSGQLLERDKMSNAKLKAPKQDHTRSC